MKAQIWRIWKYLYQLNVFLTLFKFLHTGMAVVKIVSGRVC